MTHYIGNLVLRALVALCLIGAATPVWAAASVTDGSTLILNGTTFRLGGIEAPQTDQTCLDDKGAVWTCGVEARDRLKEYIGKGEVQCIDRGADSTYRKRRIGDCSVAGQDISLNQWMVQEGWALNTDRSAKARFKAEREAASASKKGLWKGCFVAPESLRRFTISTAGLLGDACPKTNNWAVRQQLFPEYPVAPSGCDIKGRSPLRSQISGNTGIYHLPSCRSYARTKNPHRWFCTEEEAQSQGFRKSLTC